MIRAHWNRLTTRILVAGAVLVAIGVGPREAAAQMGGGMRDLDALLQPDYVRRDITTLISGLALDAGQQGIVGMLIEDYEGSLLAARTQLDGLLTQLRGPERTQEERQQQREQFRQQWQSLRDQRELAESLSDSARAELEEVLAERTAKMREEARRAFGPQIEPEVRDALTADAIDAYRQFRSVKQQLREQFVGDLMLTLTDDQQEKWPGVNRGLTRQKSTGRGSLSGESIDLFVLVAQVELEDSHRDSLAPVFDDYEVMLDDALTARNSYLEQSRVEFFAAFVAQDYDQAARITGSEIDRRVAVRDVNELYVQALAEALPEPVALTLIEAYRHEAFERVYNPTRATRAFEAAGDLDDLDPDVRDAITSLQSAYETELGIQNEQLVQLTLRTEPDQRRSWIERMAAARSGQGWNRQRGDDPVREMYSAREEVGERYYDQLISMLTPEQIETLPEIRRRRGEGRDPWGGRFGGRGGGDRGGRGGDGDRGGDGRRGRGDRDG